MEKLQTHAGKPHRLADHVLNEMRGRFGDLAIDLLGTPNKHMSTQSELRFGTHGKMVINIVGQKEGIWYDFAEGKGGTIFHLVMRERGLDFKEAVIYCARFVGISDESIKLPSIERTPRKQESLLENTEEDTACLQALSSRFIASPNQLKAQLLKRICLKCAALNA